MSILEVRHIPLNKGTLSLLHGRRGSRKRRAHPLHSDDFESSLELAPHRGLIAECIMICNVPICPLAHVVFVHLSNPCSGPMQQRTRAREAYGETACSYRIDQKSSTRQWLRVAASFRLSFRQSRSIGGQLFLPRSLCNAGGSTSFNTGSILCPGTHANGSLSLRLGT